MLLATPPAAPIVVESLPPDLVAWSLSPDATTAATLGASGALLLWSVDAEGTAHLARRLLTPPWPQGGTEHLDSIAVSPGGRHVVLRRPGGGYAVWSVSPPRVVRTVPGGKGRDFEFGRAAWAASGEAVLVENAPDHTRLVDMRDGRTLDLPIAPPWAFTPDGKAVVGATPKGLALVDLATGRVRRRFVGPAEILPPYAFSPDGRLLAAAAEDPAWKGPGEPPPEGAWTESAYVHPLKIDVWHVADGKLLRSLPGYSAYDYDQARLFFLDSRRLAVPNLGRVVDATTGRTVRTYDPPIPRGAVLHLPSLPATPLAERAVAFPLRPSLSRDVAASPDGRLLVTSEQGHPARILLWDATSRRLIGRASVPAILNLRSLAFVANDRLIAEGAARFDNPGSRPRAELRLSLSGTTTVLPPAPTPPTASLPPNVIGRTLASDGSFALAVSLVFRDGRTRSDLIRYDPRTGERAWTNTDLESPRGPLAVSPDGRSFVLGWLPQPLRPLKPNALAVFDAATGKPRVSVPLASDYWKSVFSADGKRLFVATAGGLEVRDAATLAPLAHADERQESGDAGLAPLPDGGFAAVRLGCDLRLFDADARLRTTLVSFPGSGWAAWTPDGEAWGSPGGLAHLRRPVGDRLVPVGLAHTPEP